MSGTLVGMAIPEALVGIVPQVGSVWCWEPLKDHAREQAIVTAVRWDGEECWVESEGIDGKRAWNDLSRWVEATVLVTPAHRDGFGRGAPDRSTPSTCAPGASTSSAQRDGAGDGS